MMTSQKAVIETVRTFDVSNPTADQKAVLDYHLALLQNLLNGQEVTYEGEPISSMYYPAFDTLEPDQKVVFWETMFLGILPPNSKGVVCLIDNACGDSFRFNITGFGAAYLGKGDLQDEDSL
jgi:hypothetical protein